MRPTFVKVLFAAIAVSATAQQHTFEVSTVKPNATNDNREMLGNQPGGRFVTTGTTLKLLIAEAYGVRNFQILGGPAWIGAQRWDIVAKAEGVTDRLPLDELRPMIRVLLEDRFQLKIHRENKEMLAYALTVGKSGSKLQANAGESGPPSGPMLRMGRGEVSGKKVTMPMVIQMLSQQLGRAVIDKTDLKGEYDFLLKWTPELGQGFGPPGAPGPDAPPPADPNGPTIFTAIQEQLGLRLESIRGPVETIVIDSAEKPTDN